MTSLEEAAFIVWCSAKTGRFHARADHREEALERANLLWAVDEPRYPSLTAVAQSAAADIRRILDEVIREKGIVG